MGFEKFVLRIILSFFSIFLKFRKIDKQKITFISLTSDQLDGDFKLLANALEKKGIYHIEYILFKYDKSLKSAFFYLLNCIKQLFAINTSALVIINDNNYVISNFKKNNVLIFQMWHACGAVKKFGNQIKREYEIKNYDYVLSTAPVWKEAFSQAFGVQQEQVIPLGLPRTDVLFQESKMKSYRTQLLAKYPMLKDKYVILYAPTFRGNIIKGFAYEKIDLKKVIEGLPEDVVILYKMHPLLKDIDLGQHERILDVSKDGLNQCFSISDCLVSDYSSVIFDFSILQRKMVFYVPDITEYRSTLGLNMDYEAEVPGPICTNEDELICALQQREDIRTQEVKHFCERYFFHLDGHSTTRIASFIDQLL